VRFLTRDQLRRLLETARAENPLDHLLILVTYLHACRCTEAVNLHIGPTSERISCIKNGKSSTIPCGYIDGSHIVVWRLKGSLKTVQPLVESGDPLFNERGLLAKYPPGPLFPKYSRYTFFNRFKKYAILAGLPKHLHFPHSLKHSCMYHAVKSATINELQAYAGHRSGSSTLRYLVCDEETASRAVVSALVA
jgi:integrase